ncbi:hypothetical protein PT974_09900 [Cladobotryum mycophilum]|uniref:Uncharacterized protein n=1 Tax=Cladobotryum mycophilum TaxID=491253 RepID=A0ABR0SHJ6_9HYPO
MSRRYRKDHPARLELWHYNPFAATCLARPMEKSHGLNGVPIWTSVALSLLMGLLDNTGTKQRFRSLAIEFKKATAGAHKVCGSYTTTSAEDEFRGVLTPRATQSKFPATKNGGHTLFSPTPQISRGP